VSSRALHLRPTFASIMESAKDLGCCPIPAETLTCQPQGFAEIPHPAWAGLPKGQGDCFVASFNYSCFGSQFIRPVRDDLRVARDSLHDHQPSRQGRYLGSRRFAWVIIRAVRYGTYMNTPTIHPARVVPKGTNISRLSIRLPICSP